MYNTIVLERLNKYRLSLIDGEKDNGEIYKNYKFSYLPEIEQNTIIQEYQNGNESWFPFILLGFWRFISSSYLNTVGTLKNEELIVNNIDEEINDLCFTVHKCIMKNDLKNPLGKQIHTNIPFLCLTYRKIHQFGFKASKKQTEESIQNNMNIRRCIISIDNYLEEIVYDPNESILNDLNRNQLYKILHETLLDLDGFKNNKQSQDIIKMWIYGTIYNCGYEYRYIGKQFGVTREWVRILVFRFRNEILENPKGVKFYDTLISMIN